MQGNDARATFYMFIDALSYSLIPVLAALNANKGHPITYYTTALLVACLAYQPFLRKEAKQKIVLHFRTVVMIVLCGLTYIGAQLILIYSLKQTNNSYVPTIIYQMYPLWIVAFSFLLRISDERLNVKKIFLMLLASSGIIFLYPENGSSSFSLTQSIALPVLASASVGLTVSLVGLFAHHLEEKYNVDKENSPILSNYYSRVASLIMITPFSIWALFSTNFNISAESTIIATVYGLFPMAVGAVFYFKGIRLASNSLSIHMISYISFVLAVFWVWALGLSELTKPIMIGATFIIASNILLNLKAEISYSFNAAISSLLIVGTLIYYIPPNPFPEFYDSLSVLLIFFTIMLAFLLDRMIKKTEEEESRIIDLIDSLESNADVDRKTKEKVSKLSAKSYRSEFKEIYKELISKLPDSARKQLNLFMLSRSYSISFSEIFMLILVGTFVVILGIFFRPDGFIHNAFSLIISTAVIFNIAYVFDKKSYRERRYIQNSDQEDDLMTVVFQDQALTSKAEQAVSAFMICILLGIFLVVFGV